MPDARGTVARAVNRGAMLASIFVAGAILGWVASERDLLPSPPSPPGVPLLEAGGVDPASDPGAAGAGVATPPAATTPESSPPGEPLAAAPPPAGTLGMVAVGPPAVDDSGRRTPVPTRAELEALRAALEVPVQGVERAALRGSFDEARGGGERSHHALDIPAPRGTPVLSAADGRLLALFTSGDGGLMVHASDASGRFVLAYGHLDAWADGLREGMTLRRGQPIGTVGTSGNAPEGVPHLHFSIARTDDATSWWRGTPVDPYPLLAP